MERIVKKILGFTFCLLFLFSIVSCNNTKKGGNDSDILPDDESIDVDTESFDEEIEDFEPCTEDDVNFDEEITDEEITDEDITDEEIDEETDEETDEEITDEDVDENVIYVNINAEGLNNGTSWENAFTCFHAAIDSAKAGQQIWVAKGTYHPIDCPNLYESCEPRERHFTMKAGVAIYGGFNGTENDLSLRDYENNLTILSGDFNNNDVWDSVAEEWNGREENAYHVFYNDGWFFHGTTLDENAILDGFIIRGGTADGDDWPHEDGGGIRNDTDKSNPLIRNCAFYGNVAKSGGGAIYNHEGASPKIESCTFTKNSATIGGAVKNFESSAWIIDSNFLGNKAGTIGGAVSSEDSNITITNSMFKNNSANESGGAIVIRDGGTPLIENSRFENNSAKNGGAITNLTDEMLTVKNSFFYNNSATGLSLPDGIGGAFLNHNSVLLLVNSVFKGNSATGGGAIINLRSNTEIINCSISGNTGSGVTNAESNPVITNTIIWDNAGGNIVNIPDGTFGFGESIPIVEYSNVEGCGGSSDWVAGCGTDNGFNIDEDPIFSGTAPHPLMITTGSPCIDAGDSTKVPTDTAKDIAGNDRIQGLSVDMGAYEFE